MSGAKRGEILGVKFDAFSMEDLLTELARRMERGEHLVIAFSNPEFVVRAASDAFLREYLNSCHYNLADGIGILWAADVLGETQLPERVTGTDFVPRLAALCETTGYKLFLFGGEPGVADLAAARLRNQFPGLTICGTEHGFHGDEQVVLKKIESSRADVVMVCLGNPRQERWIARYGAQLDVRLIFGNGGAMDFMAGKVSRAPDVFIRCHLEWLYRLSQDFRLARIRRQLRLGSFVASVLLAKLSNVLRGSVSRE